MPVPHAKWVWRNEWTCKKTAWPNQWKFSWETSEARGFKTTLLKSTSRKDSGQKRVAARKNHRKSDRKGEPQKERATEGDKKDTQQKENHKKHIYGKIGNFYFEFWSLAWGAVPRENRSFTCCVLQGIDNCTLEAGPSKQVPRDQFMLSFQNGCSSIANVPVCARVCTHECESAWRRVPLFLIAFGHRDLRRKAEHWINALWMGFALQDGVERT